MSFRRATRCILSGTITSLLAHVLIFVLDLLCYRAECMLITTGRFSGGAHRRLLGAERQARSLQAVSDPGKRRTLSFRTWLRILADTDGRRAVGSGDTSSISLWLF